MATGKSSCHCNRADSLPIGTEGSDGNAWKFFIGDECQGAIRWAEVGHVAYGTKATTLAALGWRQFDISAAEVTTRSFASCELIGGVLEAECAQLFRDALDAIHLSLNC